MTLSTSASIKSNPVSVGNAEGLLENMHTSITEFLQETTGFQSGWIPPRTASWYAGGVMQIMDRCLITTPVRLCGSGKCQSDMKCRSGWNRSRSGYEKDLTTGKRRV